MGTRLELHNELMDILQPCYFQPPETLKITYPCIIYKLNQVDDRKANNRSYMRFRSYQITVIDRDPDSDIYDKILDHFMMCRFDRFFTSDNLNHWILTLYY